jgi:hypothetical protein
MQLDDKSTPIFVTSNYTAVLLYSPSQTAPQRDIRLASLGPDHFDAYLPNISQAGLEIIVRM